MPGVARVEPITTARALRGPFDYVRPEGVGVGSVLVVPFGRQEILGVVTAIAEASEHDLVAPRRVLEQALPADLVALAPWIAAEYCSTPARAFSLMLPPKGVRARTALHARALREPGPQERLSAGSGRSWARSRAPPAATSRPCAGWRPAALSRSSRASCAARPCTPRSAPARAPSRRR